jgi:hypothetical protein
MNYPIPGLVELPCGCTGVGDQPRSQCSGHADYIRANTNDFARLVWLRTRMEAAGKSRFDVITNGTPEWRRAIYEMECE